MDRMVIRWKAMALICVVILAGFCWAFIGNYQDMQATQARENALQQTLTRLQNDQIELLSELQEVGTTNYIENRARTDYAYLKPGELRFEVVNPEALEGYTAEEMQILLEEMVY